MGSGTGLLIKYSTNGKEAEFFQVSGEWYQREWRLHMHQTVVLLVAGEAYFETRKDYIFISFWDTNHYATERVGLPRSWEWM